MLPTITPSGETTGSMPTDGIAALQKALEAGYGTDSTQLVGGAALRIQSLDRTMQATVQENKHFKLFNALAKNSATATVDEWTEQSDVGGFLGGSSNSEMGVISNATGTYARRVGEVKYLMTQRQVSYVQTLQGSITDSQAIEYTNGAKQLLSDAEYLFFEGDASVVPTEFDGIAAQMEAGVASGQVSGDNIVDLRGGTLANITPINDAAATISAYGNFGTPTDIYFPQKVQADFDSSLDPAFRVPLTNVPGGGVSLGSPVKGLRTSWGDIQTNPDVFIREDKQFQPFEIRYAAIAAAQAGLQPSSVNVAPAAANAQSQFTAPQAGNYVYHVTGVNAAGQSTGVISAQVAIAAGGGATLTIAASAAGAETGYVISRSRQNGPALVAGSVIGQGSDFREMRRIPRTGATTTFTDLNADIPGASKGFILNLTPGDTAITWRQLLPMVKFPLYATNTPVIPWAQMLFGYLRISKRKHHVMFKNIVPNTATWRPFAASN